MLHAWSLLWLSAEFAWDAYDLLDSIVLFSLDRWSPQAITEDGLNIVACYGPQSFPATPASFAAFVVSCLMRLEDDAWQWTTGLPLALSPGATEIDLVTRCCVRDDASLPSFADMRAILRGDDQVPPPASTVAATLFRPCHDCLVIPLRSFPPSTYRLFVGGLPLNGPRRGGAGMAPALAARPLCRRLDPSFLVPVALYTLAGAYVGGGWMAVKAPTLIVVWDRVYAITMVATVSGRVPWVPDSDAPPTSTS